MGGRESAKTCVDPAAPRNSSFGNGRETYPSWQPSRGSCGIIVLPEHLRPGA